MQKYADPRENIGKLFGDLTIMEFIEVSKTHPEIPSRSYFKKMRWYTAKCACGATEIVNSRQLRTKRCCLDCANQLRGQAVSRRNFDNKNKMPPGLDFARLKLVREG